MGRTKEQRDFDKDGKRRCIMCGEIKIKNDDFRIKRYYYNSDGSIKYITYDSRCKQCMSQYSRKMKIRSPEAYCKTLVNQIKHRAISNNIQFDLSAEDLLNQWEKQNGMCFYTGKKLDLSLKPINKNCPHRFFPSIDRQDPSLGYVNGNVVWCIYVVNRMKNDLTHKEFVTFCKTIFNKFGDKNE